MPALRTRMTARDTTEAHRVSSPLELLFDLTFVVAVAQIAAELAHGIVEGHALEVLGPYLMVFFAIWWAWMNFTWFASAYDTDDVPYRLLTLVQIGGVLVLASGVHSAASGGGYLAITLGYLIMRLGLVAQWVRAGIQHREGRTTALRYAAGVTVVQAGWLLRLLLPDELQVVSFIVLAALDVSVPMWAERTGSTAWHPHHIAERYGLFTIILLGEGLFGATAALQAVVGHGLSAELVVIAVAGLVLVFAVWWLYFSEPAGEGLAENRDRSFLWGYGHYAMFAALAALGAGLEAAVLSTEEHHEATAQTLGYGVAIPVAIVLLLLWVLHVPIVERPVLSPVAIIVACVVILVVPLSAAALGLAAVLSIVTATVVALLAMTLYRASR